MSAQQSPSPLDPKISEFASSAAESGPASLDILREVPMAVAVEIGRTEMTVHEILQLGAGSIIPLDRVVGEPVDIFVGARRLAEGEVVAIGDNLGVRITRLVAERNGEAA